MFVFFIFGEVLANTTYYSIKTAKINRNRMLPFGLVAKFQTKIMMSENGLQSAYPDGCCESIRTLYAYIFLEYLVAFHLCVEMLHLLARLGSSENSEITEIFMRGRAIKECL